MSKKHKGKLNDKGLFWWHGTPFQANQFAPSEAVAGEIYQRKVINVDLIGTLDSGPFAALRNNDEGDLEGKSIQGKLLSSKESVLILNLAKNGGGVSSYGISRESYIGLHVLRKKSSFADDYVNSKVKCLRLWLSNLDEWLLEGGIDFDRNFESGAVKANYKQRCPLVWEDERGNVSLSYFLGGTAISLFKAEIKLKEEFALDIKLPDDTSISASLEVFRSVSNLILLFTGQHTQMSWPILSTDDDEEPATALFWFEKGNSGSVKRHDCWILFPHIKDRFGHLIHNWHELEKRMGSAVYLLLSLYRTKQIYAEHSFSNIVWAIESFSRKLNNLQPSSEITDRVTSLVKEATSEDAKFLRKKLRYAAEPSLDQRITDVLLPICTGITRKSFNKFATRCARMRNDLAHHGGPQNNAYGEFTQQMREHTELLKRLYHLRILAEIGITLNDLKKIQEDSRHSIDFNFWKRRCGLERTAEKQSK